MVGCGSNSRYSGSTAEVETILAIASASHAFLLNQYYEIHTSHTVFQKEKKYY